MKDTKHTLSPSASLRIDAVEGSTKFRNNISETFVTFVPSGRDCHFLSYQRPRYLDNSIRHRRDVVF